MTRRRFVLATLALLIAAGTAAAQTPAPASRTLILSTTTSTQDSGCSTCSCRCSSRPAAIRQDDLVGMGQALALAARGEADVTLAHAPALEKKYVEEGKMLNRRLVMYNDFVVIGPAEVPARVKGLPAAEAFRRIAAAEARFVSRGDKSGTHLLEQALWKQAGIEPKAPWYIESGQGMGQTLGIAHDRRAYTLTDRGTTSRSRSGSICRSWWRRTDHSSTSTPSWRSTRRTGPG